MLHESVRESVKNAMKARDALRREVLRGMLAAFVNELVANKRLPRDTLSDDEAIRVIRRLAKQRKDSIDQFARGNRMDLADKERSELSILESFLPKAAKREEIEAVVRQAIAALDTDGAEDIGRVMKMAMQSLRDRADGGEVKEVATRLLSTRSGAKRAL